MRRIATLVAVALVALPVPFASANLESATIAKARCLALTEDQVRSLELSSGPDISNGVAVKVPKKKRVNRWPTYLIAADIADGEPGVWAVGGISSYSVDGPIDSLNDEALLATDFGADAQPGSRAAELRARIARLPHYDIVVDCLLAGTAEEPPADSSDEEFRQQMIERFGPEEVYDDGSRQDYLGLAKSICDQSPVDRRTMRRNLGGNFEGSIQEFIIDNYCRN